MATTKKQRTRRLVNLITICGMGAMTFLPLVAAAFNLEQRLYSVVGRNMSLEENRVLSSLPQTPDTLNQYRSFPNKFDRYWDDHFGFRYSMIRGKKWFYRAVLRDAGSNGVLVGRDGWMFLKATDRVEQYTQHLYPYDNDDLQQHAQEFVDLSRGLANRGIRYVLVVAPNKHSVYPEYLPEFLVPRERTRCDQLLERINQIAPGEVEIVDLRSALRTQKTTGLLYEKTGSHWNDLGAHVAYVAIIERLGLRPFRSDRFGRTVESKIFDLGKMVVSDVAEEVPALVPDNELAALRESVKTLPLTGRDQPKDPKRKPFRTRCLSADDAPEVVIFRDSFFTRLVDMIAVHFPEATYVWQDRLDDQYLNASTKLVVHEFVERKLMNSPEVRPGGRLSNAPTSATNSLP